MSQSVANTSLNAIEPTIKQLIGRMGKARYRLGLATLRQCLADGQTELEIAEEQNWSLGEVRALTKGLIDEESKSYGMLARTREEAYLRLNYRLENCIQDLDVIIQDNEAPPTAKVTAIREKGSLLQKMIEQGQSLGVLQRAPRISAHIHIDPNTTQEQLLERVKKAKGEFTRIVGEYGVQGAHGETLIAKAEEVPGAAPEPIQRRPGKSRGGLAKRQGGVASKQSRVVRQKTAVSG